MPKPEPILRSLLPNSPPSDWEYVTVLGARPGSDFIAGLLPGDTGPVVIRRRVTYGDWEPVRPDRWADEPHACACPNPPRHEATCPSTADLWRGVAPGGTHCLFCRRDDPVANRIIVENGSCFARWDNYPVTDGHVEIVPVRHVESLFDLTDAEARDMWALLHKTRQIIDTQHQPDGYTIGVNEGQAAGRTIDHLHIHLIPRRHGDSPDPRGGIRRVIPGDDPARWAAPNNPAASVDRNGCDLGCDHGDPCPSCSADAQETEPNNLLQVGWYCWRCHAINSRACRSDNVPIHVPAEWANDMETEIARRENGDYDDTDLTEPDIDRMMAEGTPVQIMTGPPPSYRAESDLRNRLAADLYERANPGRLWGDAHPDDLLAFGDDADQALATPALQQLRRRAETAEAERDQLRAALAAARGTNQRLNLRAQRLESELANYRRAVSQWEISERGTYIPHASLRTIGLAAGKDILGSVRHLKHFERVEQAEAAIARVRALVTQMRDWHPPHGPVADYAQRLDDAINGTGETPDA